jgi:DNA processing protein
MINATPRDEQAALLSITKHLPRSVRWYELADAVEDHWSAVKLLSLEPLSEKEQLIAEAASQVTADDMASSHRLIEKQEGEGVSLVTVLDKGYPENLLLTYNRPPFLWVRGNPGVIDRKAVAVVGTRTASDEGREIAGRLAGELARAGVSVISGMAVGIDTAAHKGTLDAGGVTAAVVGTGIERTYPAENRQLEKDIVESGGAIISQFWPDAPPTQATFPMRNATMSGIAIGTVVIEAGHTSGAKMQARLALEHGKIVFLWDKLVTDQPWAQQYALKPGVRVVSSVEDILPDLVGLAEPNAQLKLI